MDVATTSLKGHEAYLHALDRALQVGLVASLAVHAALLGLLPSPFHHDHPLPRPLEVQLVEVPPPPASVVEPPVEPPAPVPVTRAAPPRPEPARSPKPIREPKPARERPVATPAPTVRETERPVTPVEAEKAVTSLPVSPTSAEPKEEKATAPGAKADGSDAGPVAPPSFRAAYLRNPEPPYPTVSRRLGEQGSVQLQVLVRPDGHVASVDVHRSSGFPRLDEAAAGAVREWRFVPAKRGTTPVEAVVIVPIVFKLEPE
jgi:periplasmic protein TonB